MPTVPFRVSYLPALDRLRVAFIPLSVAAVAVLVRLPFLNWPLTGDEGNYAYTAYWWTHGLSLYHDFLGLEKPQGIFLSYALSQWLLGPETWAIRLWGALWVGATAIALFAVGEHLVGKRTGVVAALIFALFSSAPVIDGYNVNAEIFMGLPITLSIWALLHRRLCLAGAFASGALVFKPSGVVGLLLLALWLLYERAPARNWCRVILGALPLPALAVLHGALTAGLDAYLYNVIFFRSEVGWRYIPNLRLTILRGWLFTLVVWLPLTLSAMIGLRRMVKPIRVLLGLWLVTAFVGAAMGGEWTGHYFEQLLPPLAILAAAGLAAARRLITRILVFGPIVLALAIMAPSYLQAPLHGSWNLYHRPGVQIGEEVGSYIRAHTGPDDTIYVAYYQANIYHQARRLASVPYLSRVQLLFCPGAYDRIVRSIETREPVYVLALGQTVDVFDHGARFDEALAANYAVEITFDGIPLYRRKPL